ncbi:hypothetical protein GH714_029205 [Hevea brasiliensis]|uniref:Peptidase S8/S53 domain-containing protein n=1 Tax=Hevea brasiliensis TaxID=3981 RepID=A0A6A6LBV8_HEVBR|nr:hypothetical protein GH714_029205 [Hevea brasiliensis]
MIVMNDELDGFVTTASLHVLPASHVSYVAGSAIKAYINSSSSPTATILFKGTVVGLPEAPQVAEFSSEWHCALLRSAHPDWSPAAIKSAIMTTANLNNLGDKPISDQQFVQATVFDMGAGHVNPAGANNPGLIYDIQPDDYIPYLCGLGYSQRGGTYSAGHSDMLK